MDIVVAFDFVDEAPDTLDAADDELLLFLLLLNFNLMFILRLYNNMLTAAITKIMDVASRNNKAILSGDIPSGFSPLPVAIGMVLVLMSVFMSMMLLKSLL